MGARRSPNCRKVDETRSAPLGNATSPCLWRMTDEKKARYCCCEVLTCVSDRCASLSAPPLWRNNVPVSVLRCRLRRYLRNSLATRIGKLCRPAISRAIQSWLCVSYGGWAGGHLSDDSLRSAGGFQAIRNRPRISQVTVWSSNYELDGHGFGVSRQEGLIPILCVSSIYPDIFRVYAAFDNPTTLSAVEAVVENVQIVTEPPTLCISTPM